MSNMSAGLCFFVAIRQDSMGSSCCSMSTASHMQLKHAVSVLCCASMPGVAATSCNMLIQKQEVLSEFRCVVLGECGWESCEEASNKSGCLT